MKLRFIILLLVFFVSCGQDKIKTGNVDSIKVNQKSQSYQDTLVILDVSTKTIQWKFEGMENDRISNVEFSLPDFKKHSFEWKNKDFISLRMTCGSPCWSSYIFPLTENGKVKRFEYSLGVDVSRNLIIYQPNELGKGNMFRLENIKTGKFLDYERKDCPANMIFLCIDEITFLKEHFTVKWNSAFFEDSNLKLVRKASNFPILLEVLNEN